MKFIELTEVVDGVKSKILINSDAIEFCRPVGLENRHEKDTRDPVDIAVNCIVYVGKITFTRHIHVVESYEMVRYQINS